MAAKNLESDLDFAFQIQMQEAIAASFAFRPSGLTASPPSGDRTDVVPLTGDNDEVLGVAETLLLRDMESYMQEYEDRKHSEAETSSARENLDRRIHDQRLANDVLTLADEDYRSKYGDWYEKPHGSSCDSGFSSLASSSKRLAESEDLRLYFKGLVSEESNVPVAGAGIAIFDHNDNLLFHARKNLEAFDGAEMISGEAAELEALVEGLNKALAFGFNMITFCCDDYTIFHYVSNTLPPRDGKIAALVNQVALLQRKFTFCSPSLVTHDHIYKFVFESAREAIVTQISWSEESGKGQTLKETCLICFEDTDVAQMFSIDGCLHRYCFSCMKQHVEAKMHNGQIAKCPHDGCNSEVAIDSCAKFIPPNLVEIMDQRIKESAIPVTEKVYCPEPKCSALMSKNEVLEYTKASFIGAEQSGARKCMKCRKFFCINCKVPWHYTMTCDDYRRLNAHKHGDEQMLKTLATNKRWRQCAKCNHMVELLEGCYHITCRCKYEFCYICGAEWKNKRATCFCLIWDELNIVRNYDLCNIHCLCNYRNNCNLDRDCNYNSNRNDNSNCNHGNSICNRNINCICNYRNNNNCNNDCTLDRDWNWDCSYNSNRNNNINCICNYRNNNKCNRDCHLDQDWNWDSNFNGNRNNNNKCNRDCHLDQDWNWDSNFNSNRNNNINCICNYRNNNNKCNRDCHLDQDWNWDSNFNSNRNNNINCICNYRNNNNKCNRDCHLDQDWNWDSNYNSNRNTTAIATTVRTQTGKIATTAPTTATTTTTATNESSATTTAIATSTLIITKN
ncbi:putative E3 ubiquitin-protein ligase rbrA [Morus notabilis]|uniref:RBR-type E3 ubiquitin transferase n=1 Tax=Morus notabilis TaxID=981085 RepID=W9RYK3_9ROSA|nr:putative E3 ubiquitin-protein ligase rbrA [Morus notabilis]